MKLRGAFISFMCICLTCGLVIISSHASVAQAAQETKITVLNPLGTPPPIEVKQMAERLDTVNGKTIYMINTGFPNSGRLLEEIGNWFKANHPKTTMVMASGSMTNIPQNVMTEIKDKADAVILGVGH